MWMYKLLAVWLLAATSPFVDMQPTVSNSTTTTTVPVTTTTLVPTVVPTTVFVDCDEYVEGVYDQGYGWNFNYVYCADGMEHFTSMSFEEAMNWLDAGNEIVGYDPVVSVTTTTTTLPAQPSCNYPNKEWYGFTGVHELRKVNDSLYQLLICDGSQWNPPIRFYVDGYEYLDIPADIAENCWQDWGACS